MGDQDDSKIPEVDGVPSSRMKDLLKVCYGCPRP